MMSHSYRTILSGATGGIGRAMAERLAAVSSHLVLLGRHETALASLAEMLSNRFPATEVSFLAGDLNDPAYISKVGESAQAHAVNLVINNAGMNEFGSAESVGVDRQLQIVQTNLLAPMALTTALLPVLKNQADAQVVQVGSIFGYIGYPGNAAYCASKFGLRGYSQALARELSDTSVRVKYFAPRATSTQINAGAVEQLNKELKVASDQPEWVASELIRFLGLNQFELKLGFPEKLFVFLNQLFPFINDKAIRGQLPVIRKYFLEQK